MATIKLNFKKVENQGGDFEEKVIGTYAEVLAAVKPSAVRQSKAGNSWNLFKADGTFVTINMSKPLSAAYHAGDVTIEQLGQCQVLDSTNSEGEQRYYMTLPGNTNRFEGFDPAKLAAAFAKAAPIEVASTRKLSAAELALSL